VFDRYVHSGRVVQINYGPSSGKLAVIVDILDQNRALIDGPCTGVPRQILSFKRMSITKISIPKFPRGAREKTVKKCWLDAKITEQWDATPAAKKNKQAAIRASLSDFDRFRVQFLKARRSHLTKESK
jgi:large subunit ribosomal protein L14e